MYYIILVYDKLIFLKLTIYIFVQYNVKYTKI